MLGFWCFLPGWLWLVQKPFIVKHSDTVLALDMVGAACIFSLASREAKEEGGAAPDSVYLLARQQVSEWDLLAGHERCSRQEVHPDGGGAVLFTESANGHR